MTQGNEREEGNSRALSAAAESRPLEGDPDSPETAFLDPQVQEQLGRVLRSFCDDLIHQPIPDKFNVLLAQLEAKQREKK
ncbi:MAG: hypothetical protein CTY15_05565 [Methylocystis sp.]|nr:MAG: hypothetical protein CTY15_05565 [Methylocystis sp.]